MAQLSAIKYVFSKHIYTSPQKYSLLGSLFVIGLFVSLSADEK